MIGVQRPEVLAIATAKEREQQHQARMQIDTENVFEWLQTAGDHEAPLGLLDSHV